jgi:Tol biopolymer transport system component
MPAFALVTPPTPTTADQLGVLSTKSEISPDGRWMAEFKFEQPPGADYHLLFRVYRVNGSISWTIEDVRQHGLGYGYPVLHQWSRDGRYFYFSSAYAADGGCVFFAGDGWQRVDTKNGRVADLPWPKGLQHALSPDESTVAYVPDGEPLRLIFYDLYAHSERGVTLAPARATSGKPAAGNIVWSPDGSAVALTMASGDGCGITVPVFSVLRVDAASLKLTQLIVNDQRLLTVVKWSPLDSILLRDWNGYSWWINSMTGQMTSAPVAPALQ